MKDVIYREDAIEAFNNCELTPDGGVDINDAIMILSELPTKSVNVVFCKNCKYADDYHRCSHVNFWNKEDDFCSRGERRENGE